MFRTKLNILVGIVLISSSAGIAPAAYAEPACTTKFLASGETLALNYTLDPAMRAHFTMEADQQDVVLEIVDGSNNVACATSLPNPGYQTCGWQPTGGALYTARIMRPLPTTVANASEDPIPLADSDNESINVGQGSAASSSVTSTDTSASTGSAAPIVVVPTAAAAQAKFTLCSDQSE